MPEMSDPGDRKTKRQKKVLWIVLLVILFSIMLVLVFINWIDKSNGEIVSSDQKREYLIHVPEAYEGSTAVPLVISLHGFGEWPAHHMRINHWDELAEEHGFIVVYPSGTHFPKRWIMHENGFLGGETMEDVVFISDLIDTLAGEYNIDTDRIYVNGFSNGGGMSVLLACKLADRITAIGIVASSGNFSTKGCTPSRPVPVIAFHGTEDPLVPYYVESVSRHSTGNADVLNRIMSWAERNQCDMDPVEIPPIGEVSGIKYTGCNQMAQVHLYTIHGGGHSWPGGDAMPRIIVGHTTDDVDATAVMWDFFSRYSLAP